MFVYNITETFSPFFFSPQVIILPGVTSLLSPAVSKRRLPWAKVPVFQVTLHLLQLGRPEALIDPRCELVAQGGDDVAVTVEAQLLAHLKACVKKTKVGNNLWRMTESVYVLITLTNTTAFAGEIYEEAVLETDFVHLAYTLNYTWTFLYKPLPILSYVLSSHLYSRTCY